MTAQIAEKLLYEGKGVEMHQGRQNRALRTDVRPESQLC